VAVDDALALPARDKPARAAAGEVESPISRMPLKEGLVMAANRKTPTPASTVFDRALELLELRRAAEAYASRHGDIGSVGYRAAWLRFRQRVQSIDDLQWMRAKAARAKPRRDPPTSPAKQAARPRHVDVPATGEDRTAPAGTGRVLGRDSDSA
jgi:hypothetical protein